MKQAATRELYSYWDRLRGERLSPERGEIDPVAIRGILADTFMLEVDAARRYPIRLSGTRCNALFTGELKGCSFPGLWAGRDRSDLADLLACVCDEAMAVVAGVAAAPAHRQPIELELLLLPVRHLGKTHARIMGCLAPAKLATWLGLLPVEFLTLKGRRVLPHKSLEITSLGAGVADARSAAAIERSGSVAPAPTWTRHHHLFVHQRGR